MAAPNLLDERTPEWTALDVLLVRLDQEIYALPSNAVREVSRARPVTPVPGAPPDLPGIIAQRGAILPVVDPRYALGLAQPPETRASRFVTVVADDATMALLVDAVLDLVALSPDTTEPPPPALDPARARLIHAVSRHRGDHVMLLDLAALVAAVRDWS